MSNWVSYKNGNYNVRFNLDDGTKIRETDDNKFIAAFAENSDVKLTDKCSQMCHFCLKETAKLYSEGSTKEIKNIQVGDKVASFNHDVNKLEYKSVIQKFERPYDGELICIEFENGFIFKCTPNHKIFTVNRGYIRADELKDSDVLMDF